MLSLKGFLAEALAMQGRKEEALALHMDLERLSSYEGDWTAYYQDLQEQFKEYEGNDDTEPGELDITPHLTSMLHDTNTTAAQAAQYLQTATACQERGDLEEAEAHLWKAVDAYKLVKEKSTSVINSDRFLPCLELLMNILGQQG
jgi:tetratricopeptide (TPR) repeat protein